MAYSNLKIALEMKIRKSESEKVWVGVVAGAGGLLVGFAVGVLIGGLK